MRSALCIFALVLAGTPGLLAQQTDDTGALIDALKSPDDDVRRDAWHELAPAGAAAIGPLFDLMGDDDLRTDLAARHAVEAIAYHAAGPDGAADRAPVARALAQQALSHRLLRIRTFATRTLAVVGGEESVEPLAALLKDPHLRETARRALTRIPDEAAGRALADAVPDAEPEFAAALILALGARGDGVGIEVVRSRLRGGPRAVRIAAMQAAARMGDGSSRRRLRDAMERGVSEEREAAREAYLVLADVLVADGKRTAAAGMYTTLYRAEAPARFRCAAIAGLAKACGAREMPLFLRNLSAREPEIRGAAREALLAAQGSEATRALAKAAGRARGQRRVLLISILGQRGDRHATPAVEAAVSDRDPRVRLAALKALGRIGDPAAAPTLIEALASSEQAERDAAFASLCRIPGSRVTRAIRVAAATEPPEMRAVLLSALGARRDDRALPTLIGALKDEEQSVRLAALGAIARLGNAEATPALLDLLATAQGPELDAARAALSKMRGGAAARAVAAAIPNARDGVKASLIAALAPRENPEFLDLFVTAARSKNEEVALAALGALARLGDPRAAPVFLEIAEHGAGPTKAAAVSGYLRVADRLTGGDPARALAVYRKGLELATRDEERRLALQGIARVGDASCLNAVRPYLTSGSLRREAAAAAVRIAGKLADRGRRDEAVGLLKQAVEATADRGVVRDAAGTLRRLGVELDLATETGHVTHWWVLGPFADRKRMTKSDTIPTDAPVNVNKPVVDGDKTFSWKYVVVDDPLGMLDLEKAVARMDNVGAYMYAEVESDSARDVVFRVGSDDSFFLWLNGEPAGQWDGNRAWAPDQTVFDAHLRQGTNTILVKVLNGAAQWSCSVRITDLSGSPIRLQQKKQ